MKNDFSSIDNRNLVFDFSKLKGKIKEVFETQNIFAEKIGINESTLSNKLNNKAEFSTIEIVKACFLLHIDFCEVNEYFFNLKVQKNEQN